jgi:asparagine synthetase B (glutamine-hydrolysing)
MAHYCAHYSRHSETSPLTGITTLRPGELHVLNVEKLLFKKQMVIEPPDISHHENDQYYEELWMAELIESVTASMETGKRHGIGLSGGIDSGGIVATMHPISTKLNINLRDQLEVVSWSLSPQDTGDETEYIKEAAHFYRLSLTSTSIGAEYCFADMDPEFIGADSPFYLPFNAINRHMYQAAANAGVDVLFRGGFGDMLYLNHRFILSELWRAGHYKRLLTKLCAEVSQVGLINLGQSSMLRGLYAELTGYKPKGGLALD